LKPAASNSHHPHQPPTPSALGHQRPTSLGHSLSSVSSVESSFNKASKSARSVSFNSPARARRHRQLASGQPVGSSPAGADGRDNDAASSDDAYSTDFDDDDLITDDDPSRSPSKHAARQAEESRHSIAGSMAYSNDFEVSASAALGASVGSRQASSMSAYSNDFDAGEDDDDELTSAAPAAQGTKPALTPPPPAPPAPPAPPPPTVDELLAQLRSERQLPQQLWELREHVHAALDPQRLREQLRVHLNSDAAASAASIDFDEHAEAGARQLASERRELEGAIEQLEVDLVALERSQRHERRGRQEQARIKRQRAEQRRVTHYEKLARCDGPRRAMAELSVPR
jgi:hypothetical protein